MKPIIRVENLSKEYHLGLSQTPYSTLRESLMSAVKFPAKVFRRNTLAESNILWALKDVGFEVMPGEVVGIIGRNGAGKSTLLKILSRITEPTTGKIELFGRVGSLLEVGTGFHPELTGRENIFLNGAILGMRREEIAKKFDEIVDFAEVEEFIDTPVKFYSSGMYMRLAFAVAANLEPEILIVDEVLAVGDAEFQKKCLGKMKDVSEKKGRTVLFVSHNITAVMNLCSKGVLLSRGSVEQFGNIKAVVEKYIQNKDYLSEKYFDKEIVSYASVRQVKQEIHINVIFETDKLLDPVNLGFVISDQMSNPICGTNNIIDKVSLSYGKKGNISLRIIQPTLLDGQYNLSLWLGNITQNFFTAIECLSFEITAMSDKQHQSTTTVGYVYPKCTWELN